MKITALLSFYNERPEDLTRLVNSLPLAGVTHLAACDGAYALFPDAKPESSTAEHVALDVACRANHIDLTLQIPEQPWQGNETEKRTALFDLGYYTGADWYLVIDGDEHVTKGFDPHSLPDVALDVAEVSYNDIKPDGMRRIERHPRLFRAILGIHCFGAHYVYRTPDQRLLWGNASTQRLQPRSLAHDLEITHEPRSPQRRAQAQTYYDAREAQGVETGQCQACDERLARQRIWMHYRYDGNGGLTADPLDVCDGCAGRLICNQAGIAKQMGFHPLPPEPLGLHA